MFTYVAKIEYEDNAAGTMAFQDYMFEAADMADAARVSEAFRAGIVRDSNSREHSVVKSIVLCVR